MRALCDVTLRFDVIGNMAEVEKITLPAIQAGFDVRAIPTARHNKSDEVREWAISISRDDGWAHGTLAALLHFCALADGKDVKDALDQWLNEGLPADLRPA